MQRSPAELIAPCGNQHGKAVGTQRRSTPYAFGVNIAAFEEEVDAVLATLPLWVKAKIDNLIVVVERRPTVAQDPTRSSLLGLYEGVSLADRGVDYFAATPDQITIFFEPHIALGLGQDELRAEIRTTVLHELAHHLGIDDQRLHDLGWG